MNKILALGTIVLAIGLVAALFAFKVLPSRGEIDITTGSVIDMPVADEEIQLDISQIKEGLSKSEVTEILGEPLETQTMTTPKGNTVEYWYYESGENVYQIAFDVTGVTAIRTY